jgi:hypothetical protein
MSLLKFHILAYEFLKIRQELFMIIFNTESSSSSSSKLDMEESSSSAKVTSVLQKLDTPVWKTGQSDFSRLTDYLFFLGT